MARDPRKLRVFALADALIPDIYLITKGFPIEERYGLVAQMRRAALSVVTNIVEGSARRTEKDYLRFLNIANGSAYELSHLIRPSHRLGFMKPSESETLADRSEHVAASLTALIESLASRSGSRKPEADIDLRCPIEAQMRMRIRNVAIASVAGLALAGAAAAVSPALRAAGEVAMIEVEGEGARYWTRWRGPSGQGIVRTGKYRDAWSASDGVKWKVAVPGRGHSSPIIWGDHIFLTTEYDDGARLSMLAFRRSDGKKLWESFAPTQGIEHVYEKNSRASATAATDGTLVYASFGTHGLAAFDFSGRLVWHTPIGLLDNYHGSAGSPILYKDRLFLYQDHRGTASTGSFVAAYDKATGKQIWKTSRESTTGWGTPVVIHAGERDELIVSSQRRVHAYDPATGNELWRVNGLTFEVIPTPVVAEGLVICSSGRQGPTLAIRPGGSGDVTASHVAWSSPKGSPFVPSGIVVDGVLYLVNDIQSVLTAHDVKTGQVLYQGRLGEPKKEGFSASPIAYDGKVFFTNDDGETFVLLAGREFKLLHVNTLGERTLASPALVDGRWYFRTASSLIAIE